MLKPVSEGSSFGVVIVKEDRAHPPQEVGREDWPYGDRLLAERYVAGKELTCAVIGDRAMDIIDIQPVSEAFYGYDAKYAKGGSIHVLPAKIKPKIYHEVQELALKAHRALGCRGVSRADFRCDEFERRRRRTGLSGGQYPAGDDRNLAGAGNGGAMPACPLVSLWSGWWRTRLAIAERHSGLARPADAGARRRRRAAAPAARVLLRGERARRGVFAGSACASTGPAPRGLGLALTVGCC